MFIKRIFKNTELLFLLPFHIDDGASNNPLLGRMGFTLALLPPHVPFPISWMPTPPQLPVLPGTPVQQPHLVDHHASFEDGHEVRWLLAHRDQDLDWFIVVLLVQDDRLIGRGCDFIPACLAALRMSRMAGVG